MKRFLLLAGLGLILTTLAVTMLAGCASTAAVVGTLAKSAAPFLPPPWNLVAGGVGVVAAFTASHFANQSKTATLADGGHPSPIVKILSERKWAYPTLAAIIAGGKAAGWWDIDPATLATIVGALGLPAVAEAVKDARQPQG